MNKRRTPYRLARSKSYRNGFTLHWNGASPCVMARIPTRLRLFTLPRGAPAAGLAGAKQLQGKELSYNNLVDLDAAWALASEFRRPGVAIIKHNNPCGAA